MTSRVRLAALLLLAAAACGAGSPTVGGRYAGPVDIVEFQGVTSKADGAVKPYLAVANSRGDELRFMDPSDLNPVLGPGVVFPLSITTAPHPLLLASASLGDGKADVLVAVSAGGLGVAAADSPPNLQVIDTWTSSNRVAFDVSLAAKLGPDAADAQIVSLAGMPARGTIPARIFAGVAVGSNPANAKLVVIEFKRASDGVAIADNPNVVVQPLGFVPLDIAVEPDLVAPDGTITSQGTKLYLATRDRITPTAGGAAVHGVGVIDTAATAPWPVTALNALVPTVAVAAARVVDREVSTDPCSPERFPAPATPPPPEFVYAALDPDSCGPDQVINCGIATLDPATGALAADPAAQVAAQAWSSGGVTVPAQSYRAPMPVPGVPVRIAIGGALRTQREFTDATTPDATCPTTSTAASPLVKIAPQTGQRYTNAIAMVTSTAGSVYWLDLSRWGPPSEVATLNRPKNVTTPAGNAGSGTNVAVTAIASVGSGQPQVGLYTASGVTADPTAMLDAVTVWPGFTDADTWTLVWQGPLPNLQNRRGLVATSSTGDLYVAVQTDAGVRDGSGNVVWSAVANVSDPALGVRVGDVVELPSGSGCEANVLEVIAPGTAVTGLVAHPGGAMRVSSPLKAGETCSPTALSVTVRAAGFVLTNGKQGYMGRPQLDKPFAAGWKDETGLSGEELALVRKYRRRFYPSDRPCAGAVKGCYPGYPLLSEPLAPGPVLAFQVGLTGSGTATRGAGLTFTTRSGLTQTSRRPASNGSMPTAVIPYDRTGLSTTLATDPLRFFATFLDDQILFFSPSGGTTDVTDIR